MYEVLWDKQALVDLKHISKPEAKKIVMKVEHYLSKNPLKLGKLLKGKFIGLYRYRFKDYRIIYEFNKNDINVIIVRVGHRKDIYN